MNQKTETAGQGAGAPGNRRALGVIFFILLMDVIGLTILMPVAPYVVRQFSKSALMVTMLSMLYAGAQFIAAPLLGQISDRVGRRPVLLVSVLGSALGYLLFGLGGALWVLFLSRLIDGFTGGNVSTATAYIVDVSKPEERAKNFIIVGMAFGLGFIVGPAIGGVLGQVSLALPAYAAAALSLVGAGLIYWLLPELLPAARRETAPLTVGHLNPLGAIGTMARKPGLGVILLASALFYFAFDGVNSVGSLFIVNKFTVQPWQIGLLFVGVGAGLAFVQAALVEPLVKRYGEKTLAIVGLTGSGLGGVALASAPSFWMLFPIAFVQTGLTGFMWSTLGALTSNRVSEREQGQLAGVTTAISGLMAALGPLAAGAAYDRLAPASPYWLGAVILGAAALVLLRVKATKTAPAREAWGQAAEQA